MNLRCGLHFTRNGRQIQFEIYSGLQMLILTGHSLLMEKLAATKSDGLEMNVAKFHQSHYEEPVVGSEGPL